MALGAEVIELLGQLKRQGYLDEAPSIVEVGAQQLANSFLESREAIARTARLFGVETPCTLPGPRPTSILHGDLEHLSPDAPYSRDFWTWLGFDYAAIDIDHSPGSIALDLNFDRVPGEAAGKFGLVTNFGTTEHVINQLNAFNIIHDLADPSGLMVHHLPMQGMINHGIINYNPKFFWNLARANAYRMIYMTVSAPGTYYALPQNIIDAIRPFDPNIVARREGCRFADVALFVVLQKIVDMPYVPPVDVGETVETGDSVLAQRYPTVFDPHKYWRLARIDAVLDPISVWRLQRELFSRYRRRVAQWFS
jgi:hypothetical protein